MFPNLLNSITIRIFVKKTRIMNSKLTLTVEKTIIEKAKAYAKNTGRSLSDLIENYLESLTQEIPESDISPKLSKIAGKIKLPKDFNEEETLRNYFENKHLK